MKRRAAFLKWVKMLSLDIPTLSNRRLVALFFAVALFIAQSAPAVASYVSIPYVFSNNTIADPNQVNSDFNALVSTINGGLDSTNFAANTGLTLQQITGYQLANCRLTLVSGNPIGNVANGTTLYLDPWQGNIIGLYNPTFGTFTGYPLTNEISLLANTTNFPTANMMYYISVHWNGTAIVFDPPIAWAGINTPATTQTIQGAICASGTGASRIVGAVYWDGSNLHDVNYQRLVSNLPQNSVPRDVVAGVPVNSTIPTSSTIAIFTNGGVVSLGSNAVTYCTAFNAAISPLLSTSLSLTTTSAPGFTIGLGFDQTGSFSLPIIAPAATGSGNVFTALNGNTGTVGVGSTVGVTLTNTAGFHTVYILAAGSGSANSSKVLGQSLGFTINN